MKLNALAGGPPHYERLRGHPDPLRVYETLYASERYGFLYESLEEHGARGRYSFAGGRPRVIFRSKGENIEVETGGSTERARGNPLDVLRELVRSGSHALPVATFPGGAVGYFGYDMVRFLAPIPDANPDDLEFPDAHFVFPEEILIFDHLDEVVHVLLYGTHGREERAREIRRALDECEEDGIVAGSAEPADGGDSLPIGSNTSREEFMEAVERAKRYIHDGDILQVVLSQRFEFPLNVPPLRVYAALRRTNPSPYMYFLNLDGVQISGSSPEVLVKLTGRRVVTRPLAGTRPRGDTPQRDRELARELQADEKERAEHVMLVDLARNDIGRDCKTRSIRVQDFLEIERYSKVMHLVTNVEGRLRDDRDAFDLFASTFPAGTVSGAPKVRAMQIIEELEPVKRGPYAGAIGYFSFLGDMDLCIAIRTVVCRGDRGYLQVGAGVVADSDPGREYEETLNKARAVLSAVRRAGSGELIS